MKAFRFYSFIRMFFLMYLLVFSCINISAQDLNPANWSHLKGYWKFQKSSNLTKATVGNNLTLVGTDKWVTGPAYGDTATRIAIGSYYRCMHNIAPNGGGDSVNRYTLLFDFKVLNFNNWHTFFQTDTANKNDGECFIRPNTGSNPGCIGTATTSYTAKPVLPNKWYRLVISVNLGNFYRYYLNGALVLEGDTQDIDKRFALINQILFFADNDQEDDTIDVASVAIFDTCLSALDVAKIGSIDPCVVNPPVVNLGKDTTLCEYNSLIKNTATNYKKYLWSTGDTIASITINKVKLGMGKHNVWAKVTDINGCTAIDTVAVTYSATPVVNLGVNKTLCRGQSVNLVAGNNSSYKYLWKYLPKGDTLSTLNNFSVDSTGRYTAIVTSQFGCVNSDTIDVVVNPNPPKPVITVKGLASLCVGDSVILNAPTGYTQYRWQDGNISNSRVVKKSGWFKVFVTDNNFCKSVFSDSVGIAVHPNPPKPVISYTGKTEFCEADSIILNVTSGYLKYIWQDGPGKNQRIEKKSGSFYLNVVDSNNCSSPVSESLTLKMNPMPAKPVISIMGASTVCYGDTIKLKAPAGYKGYYWSTTEQTADIYITSSKKVTLFVKDSKNCNSPNADSVTLTVNLIPAKPVIKFVGDSSVCEGDSIIITSNAAYNAYVWSSSANTQTIYVTKSQNVTLIGLNSFGCKSHVSNSLIAVVHSKPATPQILKISGTELYCTTYGKYYKWYITNSIVKPKTALTQNTRVISGLQPKNYYYVVVTDSFGCTTDTSLAYFYNPAAIQDNPDQKPLVYPNPATNQVVISLPYLDGAGDVFIHIIDINGKIVSETKTSCIEVRNGISVNVMILQQGIYIVRLITSDRIFNNKIQKE